MKLQDLQIDELLKEVNSSINGLSSDEAKKRNDTYGLNILPLAKKITILKVLINQLLSPIVIILFLSSIFSFIIGENIDGIFILIVVIMDAILGTVQEWKAEENAIHLQKMIKVSTKVIRDNEKIEIAAEQLTIGDIVILEPGEKITADLRLIEANNLSVDESFLTGESMAAIKNIDVLLKNENGITKNNIIYSGSTVMTGRGLGVVFNIAHQTEMGKIACAVTNKKNEKTPLTIRMEKFTKEISFIILIIAIILSIVFYLKGQSIKEIFFAVVALSISAIPEGLPMVLTISLSIASNRMARKKVITRKLNAVEGLGSCTVIACDKTGTLTLNEQTAKIIELMDGSTYKVEGSGYNDDGKLIPTNVSANYKDSLSKLKELGKLIYLNNEARLISINNQWEFSGDAIDIACLALNLKINNQSFNNAIIASIPYESEKKLSAIFYEENEKTKVTIKGSVETILNFCEDDNDLIMQKANILAQKGYRVIGVASGTAKKKKNYSINDIKKLRINGLIGFIDPIREESRKAIMECKQAGIKVIMITGDHPLTAGAIGRKLGLINNINQIATNKDIEHNYSLGIRSFDNFVKETLIFSRITPEQKLKIIESLKRQGEFVAVTGDGVNDAPAMKSANISIAMGSGTDIAKETGSLIISDDNFMSIVEGIKQGRKAYNNIRKVVYYLISCGLSEVIFFILSIAFNLPLPFTAVQLLWINLVTDGIQDVALAFENNDENVMNDKPRNPKESLFDKLLIQETTISGLTIGITCIITWIILINGLNMNIITARSYMILIMVFMQNIHALNCRSEKKSMTDCSIKDNWFIVIGILATILLQLIVIQTKLLSKILGITQINIFNALSTLLLTIPLLLIVELFKKKKAKK